MNISDFEEYIEDVIVGRGIGCFHSGRVEELESEDGLHFTAYVDGSELYKVEVLIDGQGRIITSNCDCPYDMGEHCKHEVAVYLTIREFHTANMKTNIAPRKSLEAIVRGLSREQLETLLLDAANQHRQLGDRMRMLYGGDQAKTPARYQTVMDRVVKNLEQYDEYNGYGMRGRQNPLEAACLLLDAAETETDPIEAVGLVFATIDPLLQNSEIWYTDDASDLLEFVSDGVRRIGDILSEHGAALSTRADTHWFDKLLQYAVRPIMQEHADTMMELLESYLPFCTSPLLLAQYQQQLDALLEDGECSNSYVRGNLLMLYLKSLETSGQNALAERFTMENLDCDLFRRRAISTAEQTGDFTKVLALAQQGLVVDSDKQGLCREWKAHMLAAYRGLKDCNGIREILRELLLDGDFSIFAEYKSLMPKDEWSEEILRILNQMRARAYPPPCYSRILEAEGRAEELLAYCANSPSEVFSYGTLLMKALPQETQALATRYVGLQARCSGCRSQYRQLVTLLRRYGKLCGKAEMERVAQQIAEEYRRRPALLEELRGL